MSESIENLTEGVQKRLRIMWFSIWYVVVVTVVLLAVSLSVVRIALPFADEYKGDIESWASKFIGQPVQIGSMDAEWRGFEPLLVLKNLNLISKKSKRPFARFANIKIGINLLSSIKKQEIVPGSLTVDGASLMIVRQEDGSLTIEGMERVSSAALPDVASDEATDTTGSENPLAAWMLGRDYLDLRNSVIVWHDKKEKRRKWQFSDVNLNMRNDAANHQIDGSANLPTQLGGAISFSMNLIGDLFSADGWSGSIYVDGQNLNVESWAPSRDVGKAQLVDGNAKVRLWSEWEFARLSSVQGAVSIDGVGFRAKETARLMGVDKLNGNFSFKKDGNGWRLLTDNFVMISGGEVWPESRFDLSFQESPNTIALKASNLSLEPVSRFVEMAALGPEGLPEAIRGIRPNGGLRDVTLHFQSTEESEPYFSFNAQLSSVSTHAWKNLPGLKRFSGELALTPSAGSILLTSHDWSIDYPWLFGGEVGFSRMNGTLAWKKEKDHWLLNASKLNVASTEIQIDGEFDVDIPTNGDSPFLDLAFQVAGKNAANISKYLPRGVMKESVVTWIDRSLKAGEITSGGIVFYGPIKKFPFLESDGNFDLRLDLKGGTLDYVRGWPRIRGIDGEFHYSGASLSFDASVGNVYGTELKNVSVNIKDFKQEELILEIRGNATGRTKDKLKYLHNSPLEDIFAKYMHIYDIKGNSELSLALDIPLASAENTIYRGEVEFQENHVKADELGLELKDFSGTLTFDNKGVYSEKIISLLGKHLLDVIISTREDERGTTIELKHGGILDLEDLEYVLDKFTGNKHWAGFLSGSAYVEAGINIPIKSLQAERKPLLNVRSDLEGLGVNLPYPVAKADKEVKAFDLLLDLSEGNKELNIIYGDTQTVLELGAGGVNRGAIGIGIIPQLPQEFGFRYTGKLDRFSWSAWQPYILPEENEVGLFKQGGDSGSHYFDVAIANLELYGLGFSDVNVQASSSSQGWSFHTRGPDLAGNIFLPLVLTSTPITMEMENLRAKSVKTEKKSKGLLLDLGPQEMPEMTISANSFVFDGVSYGKLELDAKRESNGLRLNKLKMSSPDTQITAAGVWTEENKNQSSQFKIDAHTRNLGKLLEQSGFAGTIAGGLTDLAIQASWFGSPLDFSFDRLTGKVSMDVKGGRLLDVEPGAARVFGLLSIQTLPRRIFLDFRDVFAEGMAFDSVTGEFDIENGVAFTPGLVLDSPAVKVEMAGQVDLAEKLYDQVVTVTPKVGDSVPLITGILVTPAVGLTLFALNKLLGPQIDEISSLQYQVTGPWSNPTIAEVEKPKVELQDEVQE